MALTSLVLVLAVHVAAISAVEAEGNPPVAINVDGPFSFPPSFERMKPKSGRVKIPKTGRSLEPGQNPTDLRNVVWVQPSSVPGLEEPLQPAVLEPDDHLTSVTRNGSLVSLVSIMGYSTHEQPGTRQDSQMPQKKLLRKLTGKWEGNSRTWCEPGKLADESEVRGEFMDVLDGRFVRHTYEGTIQGKPRRGEELIAFNSMTQSFQSSWVDDFHMNYAILFSQGESTERGFKVQGEYDVADDQPKWGWRTEYELLDDDHLMITAYNIHPEGRQAKAVETTYQRAK